MHFNGRGPVQFPLLARKRAILPEIDVTLSGRISTLVLYIQFAVHGGLSLREKCKKKKIVHGHLLSFLLVTVSPSVQVAQHNRICLIGSAVLGKEGKIGFLGFFEGRGVEFT